MTLTLEAGELAALASALSWAMTTMLVRAAADRLSSTTINLLRSATAALLTLSALAFVPPPADGPGLPVTAMALLLISVLLAPGIGDTLFFTSLRLIGVARAMPLASTNPIFAGLLAMLFLGEQVPPQMIAGILLVLVAVYLIAGRPSATVRHARKGTLLAIGAAFLWGLGTVFLKPALEQSDLMLANAFRLPATALVIGLYGWRSGQLTARRELSRRAVALVIVAGIVTSYSTFLFLFAVHEAGAAKTSALASTSPLFTAPLAVLLFREPMSWRLLVGTVLTVAGIVLVVAR